MTSTGLVLAGAAALGAYEVGVVQQVVATISRELGRTRAFDVISGTSAGAINASALAAFADQPATGASRLAAAWRSLELGQILRPAAVDLLISALDARPGARSRRLLRPARGGLLAPEPIEKVMTTNLPFERIAEQLARGQLRGVAISATHVASGRAAVFYAASQAVEDWPIDRAMIPIPTALGARHAMASAAIPLLFPPVAIAGDLYCDGGLRQMVPLAPSLRLGAERLLVINPLAPSSTLESEQARREAATSPLYLAGKALNALFVDRTEVDLERLDQVSAILRAGRRRFGARFESELNAELEQAGHPAIRDVSTLRIDPSVDLGQLATDYATSPRFARRGRGLIPRLVRCLAERGPTRAGDLLSYLLFDGGFASELIALGRSDALVRHDAVCSFFAEPRARVSTRDVFAS